MLESTPRLASAFVTNIQPLALAKYLFQAFRYHWNGMIQMVPYHSNRFLAPIHIESTHSSSKKLVQISVVVLEILTFSCPSYAIISQWHVQPYAWIRNSWLMALWHNFKLAKATLNCSY